MSQATLTPEPSRSVFLPKQTANIYTMLLILTFLAITIGCLFLFLEMKAYDMSIKVSADAKVPPPPPPKETTQPETPAPGALNFRLPAPLAAWSPTDTFKYCINS